MVQSHLPPFRNLGNFFPPPPICMCLSEEILKAGGPFCLVSVLGEVKDPIRGKWVTCSGLTNSRWTLNALERARPVSERRREEKKS